MLGLLPVGYPDELQYSRVARLAAALGVCRQRIDVALYGSPNRTTPIAVPGSLLCPDGMPPDVWDVHVSTYIGQHSLWPYYEPFLPVEITRKLFLRLRSGPFTNGMATLGLLKSPAPPLPQGLRWCERCASADRELFGTPYWHRVHQLPGVVVCSHHGVSLYESSALRTRVSRAYRTLEDLAAGGRQLTCAAAGPLLFDVAKLSAALLDPTSPQLDWRAWAATVLAEVGSERALLAHSEAILPDAARQELLRAGSPVSADPHPQRWLRIAWRSLTRMRIHPLHALLIARGLAVYPRAVGTDICCPLTSRQDLCGSPVCDRYTKDWRAQLTMLARAKAPRHATTVCGECGFTAYMSAARKVPRVLNFGRAVRRTKRKRPAAPSRP
jgi:hypothetical protein